MKLLYCIPALYNTGGMERVLTEKVNFLAALPNYDITIVTTDHKAGQPIRFPLDKKIQLIHLQLNYADHFAYPLLKKYIVHTQKQRLYKKRLQQLINELDIDICISLCGKEIDFLGDLNVSCKKMAEIHFAMNNRACFLDARHSGFLWKWIGKTRTRQLIRAVKKIDKLVVLTDIDKKQWQNQGCVNVLTIHNPNPLHSPIQSTLEQTRVITIGRLEPQKGYDMLIDAWRLVVVKFPEWTLSIYGSGQDYNLLRQQIKCNQLEKSISLHGTTNNIEAEYSTSSILVMSSRYEGLPMSLIEGMSCGLPVVAFDCEQGPRELITNGMNGFLVPLNDLTALADKLCCLMENFELRKKLGNNAHEYSKQFNTEIIMQQWMRLFDDL
ncbi:MAG: glycosyltransferase family 4 protein [Sphingobacteriia bacterium]|jgi:glycosyltransferase involved in cell wall biosynthesis|nr:glycosyltransferase family 4 protein [Paludibacteraceae bacterium]NCA79053.1 glycosyltransferase family 4 protein [Sphingobacteriia bacterium]